MEDKGRWEGLVTRILGFSLAEKRRGLSVLQAAVSGCESAPCWPPSSIYLGFLFIYLFFLFIYKNKASKNNMMTKFLIQDSRR